MALSPDRIRQGTPTDYGHEREALNHVYSVVSDFDPHHAWELHELHDPASGRLYELDLVFLSRVGLILVEIKSHPGVLTGDSVDWTFTDETGRRRHLECPIRSVNHKARVLGGLLDRQRWPQRPWIHAAVFVSKATDIRLEGGRPPWLLTRDTVGQGLMRGFSEQPPRVLVNKPMMKQVIQGMEKLGLRPSSSIRTVNGYVLGELVDDGEGYQEHLAHHGDVESDTARVRTYLVPGATTQERRAQLERAAKREAQTLSQLGKHPGILHYRAFVPDAAMGPAVLFESFEDSLPLDAFLRQHPELTFDERFEILQQIVEAVAHCHRASVLHRNLSPASVLVRRVGKDGPLEVRVHRFQTAAWMEHSSFGTRHLHDLAHERERLYQAPEVLADPSKASIESDVFSVGCLAWLLFTDQAPAATIVEREQRLHGVTDADSGLRPSSVRGDLAVLDEAIAFATAPWAQNRAYNVTEWFRDYFVEHLTRPDPDPETRIDPRKAQKGDQLPGGLKVVRRLGTGGTAVVLHVKRGERDLALKIPHDEGCARQIESEARVLRELRHQHIVEFIDLIEIDGLPCLLMQYAGEHSLGDVLRKEGTLSLELARRYGEDLLSAVQYLEEKGLTHRDIKPGNVGFTSQAKKQQHLLLLDFSLSGADPKSVTAGTAEWRDPWLYLRQWDEAADRWSVAMVLHHALTGARPVQNPKDPNGALQVDAERFDAAIRDRLATFFRRALAKDPADRFQTAEAMRHAWVEALSEERPREDAQPSSIALSDVRPDTPVDALPLSTRARNALDRAGVPTVRELLALPRNQLSVIRGVGVQVAREIIDLADALRRMLELSAGPALLPGFLRPRLSVEDPDLELAPEASEALLEAGLAHTVDLAQAQRSRVERLIGADAAAALTAKLELLAALEPAPGSLGEWTRTLLGRASETEANRRLRILTGLDPLPEGHADVGHAAMRSVPQVAEALEIDTTHLHSSLQFMRTRRWAEHETAQALRDTLSELLDGLGPVVSFEELAGALAEFRSGTQASAEDRRLAAALVRVGLELRPEPVARWRRWGETAWIARDALSLEALGALAAEADRLAQQEPLPSSETVRTALAEAVKGTPLAELPPDLRLTLASRASSHAAASARLELYPRGMDAKRALRLSLGTLTGPGLTVERVRGRVRARYPFAEELPERPALDALLEPHGLRFDPQAGDGAGEYVRPGQSTTTSMTVAPIQRLTTAPPIAQTPRASPEAQVAAAFDELLRGGLSAGRFRVVQVRADLASAATVELERSLGVQAVSFDHAFVEALRAEASALEVDWANVEAADRAGPEGPDWSLLLQLVQPATQKLVARLLGNPETPLLLAWPGTLARYGLSKALQTLVMHSQEGDGGAVVLIVPSHADGLAPMINGTLSVPVPLPSQRLVMPESWLANAHGAESA